ncbi:MAG: hypothetical protein HYS13_09795 [Planctomycetia bacterium]|nr:hypothetical protein [Planctomycetia bacterium]
MKTQYLTLLGLVALAAGCGVQSDPLHSPAAVKLVQDTSGAAQTGGAAPVVTADGWGTIRGKFVVAGNVPALPRPNVDKDVQFCGTHGLKNETLTVGSGNELANVVVFVKTRLTAELITKDFTEKPGVEVLFDNKNCRFEPHVCLLTTKDTLLIKNSDPVGHNTKINTTANPFLNVATAPGASAKTTFKKGETLPASTQCNNHTWMGASIFPRNDPYAAKTGADGTFEIKDLPAGVELEFKVWHERNPSKLAAAGGQVQVKGGKFKFKIPKDGDVVDLGTFTVQASEL